jgi:hypothetical protein
MRSAAILASPAWLGLAVRLEDWLLAGWVALAAPLIVKAGGPAAPFDSGHPVAGLLQLAGFCGALACLATRNREPAPAAPRDIAPGIGGEAGSGGGASGPETGSTARPGVLTTGAIGPLIGGLLLVGGTGFAELGLDPLTLFYPTMGIVVVLTLLQSRLPAVSTAVRRALVTPYLLAAGGLFWTVVHTITGGAGLGISAGDLAAILSSGAVGVLGILTLGAAVYYAMLIYAPRQLVEREGGLVVWLARFGLFVVSVAIGLGWLSLLGG